MSQFYPCINLNFRLRNLLGHLERFGEVEDADVVLKGVRVEMGVHLDAAHVAELQEKHQRW